VNIHTNWSATGAADLLHANENHEHGLPPSRRTG
jgi:hypothetical protein